MAEQDAWKQALRRLIADFYTSDIRELQRLLIRNDRSIVRGYTAIADDIDGETPVRFCALGYLIHRQSPAFTASAIEMKFYKLGNFDDRTDFQRFFDAPAFGDERKTKRKVIFATLADELGLIIQEREENGHD